ncbi:MAG: hypothetical protein UV60_C0008G0020 [Parcubacteria group bacterium GW2011_GWA2_43_11]|nr:MAG: hypothetical protein UU89_C0009G0014 [Parcubacteria group bacterium GW2011_GWC2_42_11]KKS85398.1 MAG: hypothetical protein UV60_C0008G0020 [Parcubacteria group bacterium GW2011_GWA2_43_11]
MKKVTFITSEELRPLVTRVFGEEVLRIAKLVPTAEVSHVGATSIPGSLTSGDLDISINVSQKEFPLTVQALQKLYHQNHPEMWTDEFALFHKKDHPLIPISIIVSVKGSRFDEHVQQRDLLRNNRELLEEYNSLKRSFEGKTLEEYSAAKREMFGPNGDSAFLKKYKSLL